MSDNKYMNMTPELVFGLESILDKLLEENGYMAKINNTYITYQGIEEDTANGKREVFIIKRKIGW